MITLKYLEDTFNRIGVEINTSSSSKDESGDFVSVVDSDTKFSQVRLGVLKNPVFSKKVISQGLNYVELQDSAWIDGIRVGIKIKVIKSADSQGNGITIKAVVTSVDVVINGKQMRFPSFEAFHIYSDEFKN